MRFTITHAVILILKISFATSDDKFITCGSAIKLTHVQSGDKFFLDSSQISTPHGSGQQMVTLKPKNNDHSSLWLIREASGTSESCVAASPVKCGSIIRLTHLETNKNLHSHSYKSALASKQEVTCYGENGEGDESDNWEVICSGRYWVKNAEVALRHVETRKVLGGSSRVAFNENNCGGNCPIKNHLEVFAIDRDDMKHTRFKADLGVFLSK
eukprot:CAMPEP_0172500640 /NCGR_PEP_ID=MMETSP1066-20121228/141205_1 /TAXON_ID=671091 /ORGANISM="Coscinodiscus wailesii, Strain CCMP2513" /LENGTH=212 /DNA_ID=CAMNT_0013274977 /DNA_START=119 /DNA_END=757 /DNA_ORIENTATION=+